MKKLISVALVICFAFLLAIPAFAATLDIGNTTMTVDAKGALPNDLDKIYGVKASLTLDAGELEGVGPLIQFYAYVNDNENSSRPMADFMNSGAFQLLAMYGYESPAVIKPSPLDMLDVAVGKSTTFNFLSDKPIFSANASVGTVKFEIGDGAANLGVKFTVSNVVYLDKDGNELKASSGNADTGAAPAPSNPKTGDSVVIFLAVIIFLSAAFGAMLVLRKKKI